jgi:hypothetical protein
MERRRDGEVVLYVPPALRLSIPPSLHLSVSPSLHLSISSFLRLSTPHKDSRTNMGVAEPPPAVTFKSVEGERRTPAPSTSSPLQVYGSKSR